MVALQPEKAYTYCDLNQQAYNAFQIDRTDLE